MEVHVDTSLCEANGVCVGLAPRVFELDEEDELRITQPGDEDIERVSRAVERCPKNALSISEDDS